MTAKSHSIYLNASVLASEAGKLPRLPSVLRYYDDFSDEWRSIRDVQADVWDIEANGEINRFDFADLTEPLKTILRQHAMWALSSTSPLVACSYSRTLRRLSFSIGENPILQFLAADAMGLREYWHRDILREYDQEAIKGFKSFLRFMCDMSLGKLHPGYRDLVGSLRWPKTDKHAAVRLGEVFLSIAEEAAIVSYIDDIVDALAASKQQVDTRTLLHCCVLIASYQYALRPIQIAKIRINNARVYQTENEIAVHITIAWAKQRGEGKLTTSTRSIKREWAGLYAEVLKRRRSGEAFPTSKRSLIDALFGMTPQHVSDVIQALTLKITGRARNATELRHTAAQRLVDAGATKEELAEFMCHAYTDTGLVYFDTSSSQASKVNKALALSPIYSVVADVAKTRTIDKATLLRLPPDKQIGGVPHGIPIAGIGGCNLGQSLCSKNPVLSCYTCIKFIPLRDRTIHQSVMDGLRPVVRKFYDASRGETGQSPAFSQLTRTLNAVQSVLLEIDEDVDE